MRAAFRSRYLLDLLAQVPDPRKKRGRRHALAGLLVVGIAAVIAGSRSFAAVRAPISTATAAARPGQRPGQVFLVLLKDGGAPAEKVRGKLLIP